MSDEDGVDPPENPYAPPKAPIGPPGAAPSGGLFGDEPAALLRSRYLEHESLVRTIGLLVVVMSVVETLNFGIAFALASFSADGGLKGPAATAEAISLAITIGITLGVVLLLAESGLGLRRLRNWGRWGVLIVYSIALLIMVRRVFGPDSADCRSPDNPTFFSFWSNVALTVGVVAVLMGSKSQYVCSTGYRKAVADTPELRPAMTTAGWSFVAAFVVVAVLMFVATLLPFTADDPGEEARSDPAPGGRLADPSPGKPYTFAESGPFASFDPPVRDDRDDGVRC